MIFNQISTANGDQMKTFQETFGVKHPIACMAMNKVSDLRLAIAVRRAGALPSLSVFNYHVSPTAINTDLLEQDIKNYVNEFGDANILISMSIGGLLDNRIFRIFEEYRVKALEIILGEEEDNVLTRRQAIDRMQAIRSYGGLIFLKSTDFNESLPGIDGIVLKGPDGAGRGNTRGLSLEYMFNETRNKKPELKIIVAGGIGNSTQVKQYMDGGAFAIGTGTLFAACEESKISLETKEKMIASSATDLKHLSNGAQQLALVFNEFKEDNFNNSWGLAAGIKNTNKGHIFAGKGIDYVTRIKSAAEVVTDLVAELQ